MHIKEIYQSIQGSKEIFEIDIALKEYLLIGMDGGMNEWREGGGREEEGGKDGWVNLDIAV